MENLKLVRKLGWDTVRQYCIKNELYTKGWLSDYESLYNYISLRKYIISDNDLMYIAKDIKEHSSTDYYIEDIFTGLNRESYYEREEI